MKCPKCSFENPDSQKFCGDCGLQLDSADSMPAFHTKTLETPVYSLTRGTTFADRYEIIEELGKGGMGSVYRAEDTKAKEEIALKLIKPEISSDQKTIERFRNELTTARKIAHRNVCKMFDLGETEGAHFITMEYVPGEDLKSFIKRSKQLSIPSAISIAKQICEGLSEAHRLGIVHRDLKPANIMIDKEGSARIMDFGIARTLEAKGITGAGVMIGTPEYMSPEQVEAKEIDQRSDIYSIGIIFYEMLTGQLPFTGDTPLSIAMKHKRETPEDPKKINPQIPDELSLLILKCMAKAREDRFQSAEQVLFELDNVEQVIPATQAEIARKKPLPSREVTLALPTKKIYIPALIIITLAVVALLLWRPWSQKETLPVSTDKPSLAIIYFKNNTGDEGLDHWRTMISDLFIADLTQSKYIDVLSSERLFSILSDLNQQEATNFTSNVLKQVAEQGGVNHILVGNYAKAGETIRINISLQHALSEEILASEGVEGKGEESIFAMIDELTRRVKTNFKLSEAELASDIDKEVGRITTGSHEAYKYYIEGRRYHLSGDYRQSIQFMNKAIAIDPEFAMAYRSLGMSYRNLGYSAEWEEYHQKAFELADRLSERERYLIQADFYSVFEKTYDKAIEAYLNLIELYPDERIGITNLGIIYALIEEYDKGLELYEVLLQRKDDAPFAYMNSSAWYMALGLYDKAKERLEHFLHNFSDNPDIHYFLAYLNLIQGNYESALIEADKAFYLNPIFYILRQKGDIYLCMEDSDKAEAEYQKLLLSEEKIAHIYGNVRLGSLRLLQGRFEESKSHMEQGLELAKQLEQKRWQLGFDFWHRGFPFFIAYIHLNAGNPEKALEVLNFALNTSIETGSLDVQNGTLYWIGLSYLKMQKMADVQRVASELKELIQKGINRTTIRLHHLLMGMIELEKENYTVAIEYFKKAVDLIPSQCQVLSAHAIFFDPLAFAYYKNGDLEQAKREYENIIALSTGRINFGDIYAKSFYMLGKIFEKQGNTVKAIENYKKFLDLWKYADPGIAEIEDAKKRLAAISGAISGVRPS